MFDTAHVGDTVRYAERTFGLRPPVPWSDTVAVTDVQTDHYGDRVTVSDGTLLTSGLYAMAVVKRQDAAPTATYHGITKAVCLDCGHVETNVSNLEFWNDLGGDCPKCQRDLIAWHNADGSVVVTDCVDGELVTHLAVRAEGGVPPAPLN